MARRPLAVDLFCGSFGWSAGWLDLGGRVVGYDLEHEPHHGPVPRGADLILQDVRTIDGARFKDASLILASPPCQEFSYMAMPWKRAKRIAHALFARKLCDDGPPFPDDYRGSRTPSELTALFDACFRIQREAVQAAGRHIPLVVENVRGAQPWVGRSRWHYGSYHLFGDVPALMPITLKGTKVAGMKWYHPDDPRHVPEQGFNTLADQQTKRILDDVRAGQRRQVEGLYDGGRVTKNDDGSWFNIAHNTVKGQNPDGRPLGDETKIGGEWFHEAREHSMRKHSSKSNARKAASARIAKIPFGLSSWIARCYYPRDSEHAVTEQDRESPPEAIGAAVE